MTNTKTTPAWTPTPWVAAKIGPKRYGVGTEGGAISFIVSPRLDMPIDAQFLADLHLIAAAPRLLEACEELFDALNHAEAIGERNGAGMRPDTANEQAVIAARTKARTAIAAARGETP